jgi:hypothetical protein
LDENGSASPCDGAGGGISRPLTGLWKIKHEAYRVGLVMPGERKSVEPMAVVTALAQVAAQRPSQTIKMEE